MSWTIYGTPLEPGYCEVHPDIPETYPCIICRDYEQQRGPTAEEYCAGGGHALIAEYQPGILACWCGARMESLKE
jgi:hypothetical protein